jgi:hypothetical protein
VRQKLPVRPFTDADEGRVQLLDALALYAPRTPTPMAPKCATQGSSDVCDGLSVCKRASFRDLKKPSM